MYFDEWEKLKDGVGGMVFVFGALLGVGLGWIVWVGRLGLGMAALCFGILEAFLRSS